MCIFRSTPTPNPTPQPIQQRKPDLVKASRLPSKKDLVDPDEVAGVEYGTQGKQKTRGDAKKTGTDELKIPMNTGGTPSGSNTGGLNTP